MEILKYNQSESETRETTGGSGYADFPGIDSSQDRDAPSDLQPPEEEHEVSVVVQNGGPLEENKVAGVSNVMFEAAGNGNIFSASQGDGYDRLEKEGEATGGDIPAPPPAAGESIKPTPYSVCCWGSCWKEWEVSMCFNSIIASNYTQHLLTTTKYK